MHQPWFERLPFKILVAMVGVLGVAGIALLLADAHDATADPRTYEAVHGISIRQYVQRNLRDVAVLALLPAAAALRWLDRRRAQVWAVASVILLSLLLVVAAAGYIAWARSGFDH